MFTGLSHESCFPAGLRLSASGQRAPRVAGGWGGGHIPSSSVCCTLCHRERQSQAQNLPLSLHLFARECLYTLQTSVTSGLDHSLSASMCVNRAVPVVDFASCDHPWSDSGAWVWALAVSLTVGQFSAPLCASASLSFHFSVCKTGLTH